MLSLTRRRAVTMLGLATTFSLVSSLTPAQAQPLSSISALVNSVTRSQQQISELELRLGGLREEVNQKLVDLHDAQGAAEQARRVAFAAAEQLNVSQEQLEEAQAKLDELARILYRHSSTSNASNLAGADSAAEALDRATFMRQRMKDQQQVVKDLEKARTEAANTESQARQAAEKAEARAAEAEIAEEDARSTLSRNATAMDQAIAELNDILAAQEQAQQELDEARSTSTPAERDEETPAAEVEPEAVEAEEEATATTPIPAEVVNEAATRVAESQPTHTEMTDPYEDEQTQIAAPQAPREEEPVEEEETPTGSSTSLLATITQWLTSTEVEPTPEYEVELVLEPLEVDEVDVELDIVDASRAARIETVIARAESQIGVPYAWGGGDANGPTRGIRDGGTADRHGDYNKVGFDCSGLTLYAFAGVGISLPHYTGYQYQRGTQISPSEMERGDLIFYGPGGNQHVAIYLGDGMMIEAPQSGQYVQKTPVRWAGMSQYAVRLI